MTSDIWSAQIDFGANCLRAGKFAKEIDLWARRGAPLPAEIEKFEEFRDRSAEQI